MAGPQRVCTDCPIFEVGLAQIWGSSGGISPNLVTVRFSIGPSGGISPNLEIYPLLFRGPKDIGGLFGEKGCAFASSFQSS